MSTVRFGSTGRLLLLLSLPLAMGGITQSAQAQTDTINISYSLPSDTMLQVNYSGPGGPINEGTWAVPFSAYLNGNSGDTFQAWCIDLTHGQYSGVNQTVTSNSITPTSLAFTSNPFVSNVELQEAAWLVNQYGAPVNLGVNDLSLAGLQVALWGVVSGDNLSTFGGTNPTNSIIDSGNTFYISNWGNTTANFNSIVTDANTDLAALQGAIADGNGGGYGTVYEVDNPSRGQDDDTGQNVLEGTDHGNNGSFKPDNGIAPEGSSLSLFAFSVVPLFGAFWFKRRLNSAKHPIA